MSKEITGKPLYEVLIADDDDVLRAMLCQALVKAGFAVSEARDAGEVKTVLQRGKISALLADIKMPGNESLELLGWLAREHFQQPVILMTGEPTVETAIQAVGLNVYHYLVKPFVIKELVQLLADACRLAHLRHSVDVAREDFLQMSQHLQLIQEQLSSCNKPDIDAGVMDYLAVVMNSILCALQGGAGLLTVSGSGKVSDAPQVGVAGQTDDLHMLTNALKETVAVLEKTKSSFKSKELGQLRKKLNLALELVDEP